MLICELIMIFMIKEKRFINDRSQAIFLSLKNLNFRGKIVK